MGPVEGVHRLGRVFQAHLAQGGLQAVVKLGEARGQGQGKDEGEGQDQTSSHPLTSLGARRLSLCMSCPTLASSRAVTPTKPPPTGRRRRSPRRCAGKEGVPLAAEEEVGGVQGNGEALGELRLPRGVGHHHPRHPTRAGEAPGEAVPLFGVGQVHRLEGRCGLRHRLA